MRLNPTFGLLLTLTTFTLAACQQADANLGGATPADAGQDHHPVASPSPSSPTLLAAMPADGTVGVAANQVTLRFSASMDRASTIAAVTFNPAVDCDAAVEDDTYSCKATSLQPSTTYVVIVHPGARSTSGAAIDGEHSVTFTTAAAIITSVTIAGTLGKQVRQGAGEIILTATGRGLAGVSAATLGGLSGSIVSAADTEAVLRFFVPHGQTVGGLTLSLTLSADSVEKPEAVVVTELAAAAGVGNDAWAGTPDAPFATLSRALSLAASGDVIKLADGVYSANETWSTGTPNVPAGVSILGTSVAGTVLQPASAPTSVLTGLCFAGKADVARVTVRGFLRGAVAHDSGYVSFDTVRITGSANDGLSLSGSAQSLANKLELDGNGAAGVRLADAATLDATAANFHDNMAGVIAVGTSRLGLLGGAITHNGIKVSSDNVGVSLMEQASASIVGDVTGNASAGVYSTSTGPLQLEGAISSNGTAQGCGASSLCSGVVIAAEEGVTIQAQLNDNHTYGLVSRGKHAAISLAGATLSGNGVANAVFDDTDTLDPGFTSVQITNTTLSNSPNGIMWGDHVKLNMSGGSLSGHTTDLSDAMTVLSFPPTFSQVRFGATLAIYPPKPRTLIESSASNTSGIGPSWSIANPAATGGAGAITFVH